VIVDGLGQSQAIGLTRTLRADVNQVMEKMKEQSTTSISLTTLTRPTTPLRTTGHLEELAPVSLTTIAMAVVNAIGPGLQQDHGMISMPHVDANQALAILQTLLTTQTHQTTQPLTAGPSEVRVLA
jgi:hypothetical protein